MADQAITLDASAYLPNGKKENYAVSRRTRVPITFTEDLPKGEQGEYDSGSIPAASPLLTLLSFLPHLASALGPQIKINPNASYAPPINETIGHENVHALEDQNPVDISSMPIASTAMPLLQNGTGSTNPNELPAYASMHSTQLFDPAMKAQIVQQYMQKLQKVNPKAAGIYNSISKGN